MTFDDFSLWALNASFENNLEQQVLNRIVDYVSAADASPGKNFRLALLGGMLARDRDAFALALRNNPDWAKDLQKAIYGEAWSWKPNQVAQLLDFNSPEEMFKEDKETKLPAWRRRFTSDDPEKMAKDLGSYYLEEQNIDPKQLVKWLQTEQSRIDREKKYSSPGYSALSFVAPRTVESLRSTDDFSGKDVGLDVAENILQMLPYGRIALGVPTLAAKVLYPVINNLRKSEKARKLLNANSAITKADKYLANKGFSATQFIGNHPGLTMSMPLGVLQAGAAPAAMEVADAVAYTPEENQNRSEFNPKDVAEGMAINFATPLTVGSMLSGIGQKSGLWGSKADDIANQLGFTDPYVDAKIAKVAGRLGSTGPTSGKTVTASLEKDADILGEIEKDVRNYQKSGKQSEAIDNWEKGLTPEQKAKIEAIKKNMEIKNRPGISASYESEFSRQNPNRISETKALEDAGHGDKFGLDENDNLIYIKKDYDPNGVLSDNPQITIPTGPSGRSFKALRKAELDELEEIAKKSGKTFDRNYPGRVLEVDKKIQARAADPTVQKLRAGAKAGLGTQMAKVYTGNKLGQQKFGSSLVAALPVAGPEFVESFDYPQLPEEEVAILKDPDMIRMWKAGFAPHENEADPMWRAYKYYVNNMRGK